MRKLFIFLGIMVISLVLVGCTGGDTVSTPPSYTGIKVEDANPVDGTDFVTFYRAKHETVEVEIGIENPDTLTIKSVVINGITYNSHRFLEKSTFSTIYFDMSVGTALEETVYSVDKISYLDGENTKSIEGFSNNEFSVYVYKDLPSVERENYTPTKESISIDFNVTDLDSVIDVSTLRAELYSGETLVESIDMDTGMSTVLFDELLSNKFYEVKVVASYDIDDNTGVKLNTTLYSENYLTLSNTSPSGAINNPVVDSNKVTFDVEITDEDEVILDGRLKAIIYNGTEQLMDAKYTVTLTGDTVGVEFTDLYNDNEYTIKVIADYDLLNGEGAQTERVLASHTFTTLPRSVPTPQILELNLLENSIEFDIEIVDPLGIIDKTTLIANLYIDDALVDTVYVRDTFVDMQISNLLADSEIVIELVATYDLNDGEGPQADEVIYSVDYTTQINAQPIIVVQEIIVEQGYVTLEIDSSDVNDTLIGPFKAELYEEGTVDPVGVILFDLEDDVLVFNYATKSKTEYYIEVTATYDLRDGSGRQEDDSLRVSIPYDYLNKAPIAEINNVVTGTETITFDLNVIDADDTILPGTITVYLYHMGIEIDHKDIVAIGETAVTFDLGILSNNEYEIVVEADFELEVNYELDIVTLLDQELSSQVVMTLPKDVPTAIVKNETSTTESITFDVLITDEHTVIEEGTVFAKLYLGGIEKDSIELDELEEYGVTFDFEILSNNNYTIEITTNYNLNDGNGVDSLVLATFDVGTVIKETPAAVFENDVVTKDSFVFDINLTDDDDTIIMATLVAILVIDDVEQLPGTAITSLSENDIAFTSLYSDQKYDIVIKAELDYNDGETPVLEEIATTSFTTDSYENINVNIDDIRSTPTTFEIDLDVADTQSVYEGNLEAVAYEYVGATKTLAASTSFGLGDGQTIIIEGLESDTEYYVVIEASVNLETQEGIQDDFELYGEYKFTEEAPSPTENLITFTDESITEVGATFSITVEDDEDYLTTFITAKLVQYNGEESATFIIAPDATTTIDLSDLLSDNVYQLILTAQYDPNTGVAEDYEYVHEFTTLAYVRPEATVSETATWVFSPTTLSVVVSVDDDTQGVANNDEWFAVLYEGDQIVSTVDLDQVGPQNPEGTDTIALFTGITYDANASYTVVVTAALQMNTLDVADDDYEAETVTMVGSRTFISAGN